MTNVIFISDLDRGFFIFCVLWIKLDKIMESSNSKKNVPQLWYWSQPENGFSFEDAETIAKEFVFEAREDKSGDRFLHIAFV